ncbi:MAG: hypothetical protein ACXWCH_21320 [Burkholderiales bacterium]
MAASLVFLLDLDIQLPHLLLDFRILTRHRGLELLGVMRSAG